MGTLRTDPLTGTAAAAVSTYSLASGASAGESFVYGGTAALATLTAPSAVYVQGNYEANTADAVDSDLYFDFVFPSLIEAYITASIRGIAGNYFYTPVGVWLQLQPAGGNYQVGYTDSSGNTTVLSYPGLSIVAGTKYTARLRAVGTGVQAKVWPAANAEPAAWDYSGTQSTVTSGSYQTFGAISGGSGQASMQIGNVRVYDANGQPTSTPVAGTASGSGTVTARAAVTSPVAGTGSGTGSVSVTRAVATSVSGSAASTSSVTATRAVAVTVTGTGSGSGAVQTGNAQSVTISGTGSGSGVVTASQAATVSVAGSGSGVSAGMTSIATATVVAGTGSGVSGAQMTRAATVGVAGAGTSSAAIAAQIGVLLAIAGMAVGSGVVVIPVPITAAIDAQATLLRRNWSAALDRRAWEGHLL